MKEVRLSLLSVAVALPLAWSASLSADTRSEALNDVLAALLVGILPLLAAMLLWEETFRGADIDVRYGKNRRNFALRTSARILLTLIIVSVAFSWCAIGVLRGLRDPRLLRDLMSTTAVALPAALAIGAFLGAARAWLGKPGLGIALIIAWALGPVDAIVSAIVPTGHVRFLVGAGADLPLPGWGSLLILWAMAGIWATLLMVRVPR
jgi:hypothetical protein